MLRVSTLLRQVRNLIPNTELQAQIDQALVDTDVVENVGRHAVDSIVLFKPSVTAEFTMRAKVLRNRGNARGKVLYDLALALTDHKGEEVFHTDYPLIGVDSAFVASLNAEDDVVKANADDLANGIVERKVMHVQLPDGETVTPAQIDLIRQGVQNAEIEDGAGDTTFALKA